MGQKSRTEHACLAWAVWKNRNKMAIEKEFPTNPDVDRPAKGEGQKQDEAEGSLLDRVDE